MKRLEQVFIKTPEQPDLPEEKMVTKYLRQEMQADLDAFPKHLQALILKRINGHKLDEYELEEYKNTRNSWWEKKYGFPYSLKAARNEVLLRKYGSPSLEQLHHLQAEYFHAVQANDEEAIQKIKERYWQEFPDAIESVEVLFAFRDIMLLEKNLHTSREEAKTKEARMEIFQNLTEYQFLFTHFLIENSSDKAYLEAFWDTLHQIAKKMGVINELNMFQRGQISQVAVYKIMQQLGFKPKLSHPREDAFQAVDLWSEEDEPSEQDQEKPGPTKKMLKALQVKGWNENVPALIQSKEVTFPAVETEDDEGIKLFNTSDHRLLQRKNRQFFAKVDELNEERKKKNLAGVSGYMMVVPYSKMDFITGEPDQEIVEFFQKKINPSSGDLKAEELDLAA